MPSKNDADRFERIVDGDRRLDPAAAERVPDRRRHVGPEGGQDTGLA